MKDNRRTQVERSAATKDALVRAARPLFAEHGFAGVGTEAIVRAAGVTRGAMYHQFADKSELFAAVFEAVEADLTQRIGAAVDGAGLTDPIELMKLGARTWLDACAEPEAHRILLVEAPAVLGWERWREVGLRYGMGLVQTLLAYAISVGRLREQPVEPLAHVFIGALDEAALYVAQSSSPDEARAGVVRVLEDLIDALAVEPAR
ncbi:MAG TPA: TetR/AcrR family transcriptional regulator [Jatrophihabitans sp.]|nr:TetR/AcrR family transcriptional regulator [Jatrophihabitans sp.]